MSRILLLEPNRLLAKQYAAFLKSKGHSVVACEDAQSGINAADGKAPDLIIAELLLAGHSGIEFLYEFRSYAEWCQVPVLILSSVPLAEASIPPGTMQELGVSDYLYKSDTTLERLGRQINRALLTVKK